MLKVGDTVTPKWDIYEEPSGDSPGGILARPGCDLVIRRIVQGDFFPFKVSHRHVTNNSFGVTESEIELTLGVHGEVKGGSK